MERHLSARVPECLSPPSPRANWWKTGVLPLRAISLRANFTASSFVASQFPLLLRAELLANVVVPIDFKALQRLRLAIWPAN